MNDNVVDFPGQISCYIKPEKVLTKAIEADLKEVIVVGRTETGEVYFAFADSYIPDLLYLLLQAQQALMES